ncbi:ankyrin repeat-containing domain protein [Desarmillaria ectypa]|nr:ankyrin repeat-containing domain protein [Desarmillaria ectypa]
MSTLSIHNAAQSNQPGLLKALVTENPKSVNICDADNRTPLHWAASSDNSGWTPLHIAASAGNEDVVLELVGAGADVNRKNDKGLTPLHYAASKSRLEIGKLLISRGADINAKDRAGQVPLQASRCNHGFGGVYTPLVGVIQAA